MCFLLDMQVSFYHNAQKVQDLIRKDFANAFSKFDVLMMPSQACPAFEFGKFDNNKITMDLQDYFLCRKLGRGSCDVCALRIYKRKYACRGSI